jgi:hypothetical protein
MVTQKKSYAETILLNILLSHKNNWRWLYQAMRWIASLLPWQHVRASDSNVLLGTLYGRVDNIAKMKADNQSIVFF